MLLHITKIKDNKQAYQSIYKSSYFFLPGTLYFLLQISICDIVSLFVASAELLYIQQQHWTLPPESCPVYLALESFSSIATVYLLIALNLHAISTYNLARRTMWREKILTENREEPLVRQSEQNRPLLLAQTSSSTETSRNEIDTENHYSHILSETPLERPSSNVSAENTAVAANVRALDDGYEKPIEDARCSVQYESTLSYQTPSATRSLLIDYSRRKTSVSVVLPVVFVWFVAASASTPLFVFGSVLPSTKVSHVCGVVNFDPHNNQLLQVMVLAIRVVLPTGCLLLTALSVAWTLCAARTRIRPCGLDENVRACLRLALVLSAIYIVTSEQRVFGSQLFEVWSRRPLMLPKYPRFSGATALTLSAVHWMASIIRPLVYWFLDETVRLEIKDGFGWLCGTRSKREGMQSRFLDGEGKP